MQGTVKWFSVDKGYGFITSENGEDHYFRVDDVRGDTLPTIKSRVEFDAEKSARGLRAKNIRIVSLSKDEPTSRSIEDRVTCGHCGKKMVPRLQYWRGSIFGSNCPFCLQPHLEYQTVSLVNWSRVLKPLKYLGLALLAYVVLSMLFAILSSLLGEL